MLEGIAEETTSSLAGICYDLEPAESQEGPLADAVTPSIAAPGDTDLADVDIAPTTADHSPTPSPIAKDSIEHQKPAITSENHRHDKDSTERPNKHQKHAEDESIPQRHFYIACHRKKSSDNSTVGRLHINMENSSVTFEHGTTRQDIDFRHPNSKKS